MRTCAAFLFLCLTLGPAVNSSAQTPPDAFDPSGAWSGPCKSERKVEGTLEVTFARKGRGWTATGGLKSSGYPQDDNAFEEVKVQGSRVAFLAIWGPTLAEFEGTFAAGTGGGKINGKLQGKNGDRVVFGCSWVLTRKSAK